MSVANAIGAVGKRLELSALRGDPPAVHDAALQLADLAELHALPRLRIHARALLGWHEDERLSASRLSTLLCGLRFAIADAARVLGERPRHATSRGRR